MAKRKKDLMTKADRKRMSSLDKQLSKVRQKIAIEWKLLELSYLEYQF